MPVKSEQLNETMIPLRDRMRSLLKMRNVTCHKVANGKGTMQVKMNLQINKDRNISYDVIKAFLDYFSDVSAEWLIRGEGPMERCATNVVNVERNTMGDGNIVGNGNVVNGNNAELQAKVKELQDTNSELVKLLMESHKDILSKQ